MIDFDPPSEEFLAGLREKHGDDIRIAEDGDRVFVLVKPANPRAQLERMTTMSGNDKKKLEAAEGLVRQCCVYPDKDTLKRVLEDEPGLALALFDPASELLGLRQLAVKKA